MTNGLFDSVSIWIFFGSGLFRVCLIFDSVQFSSDVFGFRFVLFRVGSISDRVFLGRVMIRVIGFFGFGFGSSQLVSNWVAIESFSSSGSIMSILIQIVLATFIE